MQFIEALLTTAFLLCTSTLYAADLTGLWQTTDDHSGKPRSLVRIVESGG